MSSEGLPTWPTGDQVLVFGEPFTGTNMPKDSRHSSFKMQQPRSCREQMYPSDDARLATLSCRLYPFKLRFFRTWTSRVLVSTFRILIFQDQDFRLGGIYSFKISTFGILIGTKYLGEDFTWMSSSWSITLVPGDPHAAITAGWEHLAQRPTPEVGFVCTLCFSLEFSEELASCLPQWRQCLTHALLSFLLASLLFSHYLPSTPKQDSSFPPPPLVLARRSPAWLHSGHLLRYPWPDAKVLLMASTGRWEGGATRDWQLPSGGCFQKCPCSRLPRVIGGHFFFISIGRNFELISLVPAPTPLYILLARWDGHSPPYDSSLRLPPFFCLVFP